jgi:hypothetical protein
MTGTPALGAPGARRRGAGLIAAGDLDKAKTTLLQPRPQPKLR